MAMPVHDLPILSYHLRAYSAVYLWSSLMDGSSLTKSKPLNRPDTIEFGSTVDAF